MAWETLSSRDGIYYVDWDVIGRMIRSFVRSKATLAHSKPNDEYHWFTSNIHTIDVDWDTIKHQTDFESQCLLSQFHRDLSSNTECHITRLANWLVATNNNNAAFQAKMREAQRKTMANIEKTVAIDEGILTVLRGTRDLSAEFLMVSATMVAVPVGVGALVVGSGLKTARRGQDENGTAKQMAATFATEFAFGLVDLGAAKGIEGAAKAAAEAALKKGGGKLAEEAAKRGTKVMLGLLYNHAKLAAEPAKAVLQGKHVQEGLVAGGLKTIGGIHGEILKYIVLDDEKFPKLAAIADTVISFGADKAAEALVEANKGEKSERSPKGTPRVATPTKDEHLIMDALAYDRNLINQIAIRKIGSMGPQFGMPFGPGRAAGFGR